jgi:hypothetical protein
VQIEEVRLVGTTEDDYGKIHIQWRKGLRGDPTRTPFVLGMVLLVLIAALSFLK